MRMARTGTKNKREKTVRKTKIQKQAQITRFKLKDKIKTLNQTVYKIRINKKRKYLIGQLKLA